MIYDLKWGTLDTPRFQICIVWDEQLSYIHFWDPRNPEPRIVYYEMGKISKEMMNQYACHALNSLGIRTHEFGVQWISQYDWKELPENFEKLNQVFDVEVKEINDEQLEYIKESFDVIHSVQPELQV